MIGNSNSELAAAQLKSSALDISANQAANFAAAKNSSGKSIAKPGSSFTESISQDFSAITGGAKSLLGGKVSGSKTTQLGQNIAGGTVSTGGLSGAGALGDIGGGALLGAGAAKLLGQSAGKGALIGAGAGLAGNLLKNAAPDLNAALKKEAATATARLAEPCVAPKIDPLAGAVSGSTNIINASNPLSGITNALPSLAANGGLTGYGALGDAAVGAGISKIGGGNALKGAAAGAGVGLINNYLKTGSVLPSAPTISL